MKYILSLILAVIIGIIINANTTGAKTSGHYGGVVLISVIAFFILVWLIGLAMNSNYVKEKQEDIRVKKEVEDELVDYQETKKSFKYFSDEKLLELLDKYKSDGIEDLHRLAIEEELVERKLIKSSDMHEKLYNIKRNI